jgi:N-acyl-L-homoserine lactone synthetase
VLRGAVVKQTHPSRRSAAAASAAVPPPCCPSTRPNTGHGPPNLAWRRRCRDHRTAPVGPILLGDIFSDTVPDAVNLSAPTIWECTRFCLDEKALHGVKEKILFASSVLLIALGDLALKTGIESIIANFDRSMLHLWRRIGYEVDVLGSTSRYGRPVYLGSHPISEGIVNRIKKKLNRAQSAFEEARVVAA